VRISVIIPTKDRPLLLESLLGAINHQSLKPIEVIVVDSSKHINKKIMNDARHKIKYIRSAVKSAAIQRNIGIENIDKNSELLIFLDDDVLPDSNYFEEISKCFINPDIIGVSGLAINSKALYRRTLPSGLIGFLHRIFLLDSRTDGIILKSGVNIPVRKDHGVFVVEWLIGCSAWRHSKLGETRFESDFFGQSLGEDVIFSYRMSHKGKLIVNSEIKLQHLESSISRPDSFEFWKMWMLNRYRLINTMGLVRFNRIFYWWSSLGQLIILIYSSIIRRQSSTKAPWGLIRGSIEVILSK
jgi:glycosyltransferase involved in cell wall biosynthesis